MNTPQATAPLIDGAENSPPIATAPRSGWRAVAIGAVLVPVSVYFGNYAFVVTQALLWGQTSLLRGPVFVLFVLAILNLALRGINRRLGLNASELVIIYSMVAVATCVSGFGMVQWLVNILPAGAHLANSTNHYERFLHLVPAYLVPHDKTVIQQFYDGRVSFASEPILRDWATPIAVWSAFIVAMCWVTLCVSVIVSRPWIEGERLTFPLVELPIRMIRGSATDGDRGVGIFASKLMWAGFAVAGGLESIDFLHYFYPSMPFIPIKPTHLEPFLTTPPWSQMGMLTVAFYPFAIGIAFLVSREVAFSCWFFYLLTKLENVAAGALGYAAPESAGGAVPVAPYIYEQGVGAFVALGVILLARVAKQSGNLRAGTLQPHVAGSLLSNRTAVIGAAGGIVALTAFATMIGLPLWASVTFWGVYFLIVTVLARIVSEAGAGWAFGTAIPVHGIVNDFVGVNSMSPKALTAYGMLSWFELEFRDNAMPHQLAALKMGDELGSSRKPLLTGLVIASVLGTIAAFLVYLDIYYTYGAASAKVRPALQGIGLATLDRINNWLINPTGPKPDAIAGMAVGAAVLTALVQLSQWFVWWPLHPIGYVLAGTQSMDYMWCPFFIGWAIKSVTLRYWGPSAYTRVLPFFLGLILGDYIVPMLWGMYGMYANVQVYMAFPH